MSGVIFWDVDTQYDFIMPDGKLYVDGSEKILGNLEKLTGYARENKVRILGSVDNHGPNDSEISDNPDFLQTFPPHCLEGSTGQEKIPETRPRNPFWVDPDPADQKSLIAEINGHPGEVLFRKKRFDVFTNPNVDPVLDSISPERIVVYGVALDVCNAYAIEGLLQRKTAPVALVLDATRAIDPKRGENLVIKWQQQGVKILSTQEVVEGGKIYP